MGRLFRLGGRHGWNNFQCFPSWTFTCSAGCRFTMVENCRFTTVENILHSVRNVLNHGRLPTLVHTFHSFMNGKVFLRERELGS